MIAKGEKASINFLAWTLQEALDVLRPAQEKCEAPPEPMLLFAGCWTKWQWRSTKKIFSPVVRVSRASAFLGGVGTKYKIKDISATSQKAREGCLTTALAGVWEAWQHRRAGSHRPCSPAPTLSSSPASRRQQGLLCPLWCLGTGISVAFFQEILG